MDTNNPETDAKTDAETRAKFTPITHVVLLLGILIIAGITEIYFEGLHARPLVTTLPSVLGRAIAALGIGSLVAVFFKKSRYYPLFYIVAYIALFLSISAALK